MQSNIILLMSLSGSIVYILYLFVSFFSKRYFSVEWRYRIIIVSLIFYLTPFQYFRYIIQYVLESLFPLIGKNMKIKNLEVIDISNAILINNDAIFLSSSIEKILFFIFIMGIVTFIIIFFQIYRYITIKKKYLCLDINLVSDVQLNTLWKIQKEVKCKKNIKLIVSESCQSPFVIGIFSPSIIFPLFDDEQIKDNELEYIIRHELIHIKNKHLLIKFIGLLTMAIHWFNPFCYLVFLELSNLCEYCCDFTVCKNLNEKQKKYIII